MKYLVIGDIHGCSLQLRELLNYAELENQRRMVFLGDYVDVGPSSADVIGQLCALRAHRPDTLFLKGNHDYYMTEYIRNKNYVLYAKQGGIPTIKSYTGTVHGDVHQRLISAIPENHLDFLRSLLSFHETETYLFSHCGYDIDRPNDRSVQTMVSTTHPELFSQRPSLNKTSVCGHYYQRTREPHLGERLICLDTGCGILRGPLTAMLLPERSFVQVSESLEIRTSVEAMPLKNVNDD